MHIDIFDTWNYHCFSKGLVYTFGNIILIKLKSFKTSAPLLLFQNEVFQFTDVCQNVLYYTTTHEYIFVPFEEFSNCWNMFHRASKKKKKTIDSVDL